MSRVIVILVLRRDYVAEPLPEAAGIRQGGGHVQANVAPPIIGKAPFEGLDRLGAKATALLSRPRNSLGNSGQKVKARSP